jgi:ATP phosphoribosyltransferase regulatory subunit
VAITAACGAPHQRIIVGDVALFSALLAALEIPPAWRARLTALFGEPEKIADTLARLEQRRFGFPGFAAHAEIIEALSAFPAEKVGQLFADILSIAGVKTVGGRTTGEIAERVLEQALLAASDGVPTETIAAISDFMSMQDENGEDLSIADGVLRLEALSSRIGDRPPFRAAVDRFKARVAAIAALGVDLTTLHYAAGFGRRLGYYDGFVFDIHDANRIEVGQVSGGGRYDGLVRHFKAAQAVKAVGFAVWPERFRRAS